MDKYIGKYLVDIFIVIISIILVYCISISG